MSEAQLREAYTLMKQGDKRGAAKLVQDVLREDRNNLNAWWLFSYVLEDEEKIVKSLEKVLAINPEHPGARKRLSQMRPEYAHLAPITAPGTKSKGAKAAKKESSALGWILGIGAFVVSAFLGFGVVSMIFNEMSFNPADVEGPPPEEVAILQITAAFKKDFDTMRLYTCDSLEDEWLEIIRDVESDLSGSGVRLNQIEVDFSGIILEESENTGRQITYDMRGEMRMSFQGQHVSLDITELAGFVPRMVLVVNDNRWVVCSL